MSRCAGLALVAALAGGCKKDEAKPPAPAAVAGSAAGSAVVKPAAGAGSGLLGKDSIPHTTVPIKLDGEWDEVDWVKRSARFIFLGSDGERARPHSEVRFLHDDTTLYVGLYAGDENLQSATDAFDVTAGKLSVRVGVDGKLTPVIPEVHAAVDHDGTLDDPKDDDEEWVVEVAIPLTSTGWVAGQKLDVKAARCDITKDNVKRCGSWSGSLGLDPN